jgi:hypothetical protein
MSIFRRKDEPGAPAPTDDAPEAPEAPEGEREPDPAPAAPPVPTPRGTIVPRPLPDQGLGGRIVSPRNGETLSGVVQIEVQAAELDGAVERIEVEYSTGGGRWRDVAAVQDEPYDLFAVLDDGTAPLHVAVVRSWRLAQFFRLVLEGQPELDFERVDVRPSDTTAWEQHPVGGSTEWNTNGLGDGRYKLRATTVGAGGTRATTPEVAIVVDNTPPEVRLLEPSAGDELEGAVALRARADDAGSTVERVAFELSLDGETWDEIGACERAPWEIEWETDDAAGEDVQLRLRALDSSGHEQTTASVRVSVVSTAPVVELEALAPQLRGRIALSATIDRAELVREVDFQLAEEDSGTWLTVASATEEPFAAPFDSTVLADGRYELRAAALPRKGATVTTEPRPHRIDNTPPVVRLDVPAGGFVAGTVELEARAHDEGSGIESVVIELRPEDGRWSELARNEEEPLLAHTWNTAELADGHYELRVAARDRAGNERRPELVALVVDNSAPLVELVEPGEGARIAGIVAIGAEIVDSCSGLAWLKYEWSGEDGEWHELPRGSGSVTWRTVEVPDGEYRLRVRAADRAGNAATSDEVAVVVENEEQVAAQPEPEPDVEAEIEPAEAEEEGTTRFGPVPSWAWQDDEPGDEPEPEAEPEAEEEPEDEPEPEDDEEPELERPAEEPERSHLVAVPDPEPDEEPEAEPEPESEPEPEPRHDPDPIPAAEVVALPRSARRWDLWELDRLADEVAADDPRAEERRAVLYFLRDHAGLDGSIPPELEPVVLETFGDLLR